MIKSIESDALKYFKTFYAPKGLEYINLILDNKDHINSFVKNRGASTVIFDNQDDELRGKDLYEAVVAKPDAYKELLNTWFKTKLGEEYIKPTFIDTISDGQSILNILGDHELSNELQKYNGTTESILENPVLWDDILTLDTTNVLENDIKNAKSFGLYQGDVSATKIAAHIAGLDHTNYTDYTALSNDTSAYNTVKSNDDSIGALVISNAVYPQVQNNDTLKDIVFNSSNILSKYYAKSNAIEYDAANQYDKINFTNMFKSLNTSDILNCISKKYSNALTSISVSGYIQQVLNNDNYIVIISVSSQTVYLTIYDTLFNKLSTKTLSNHHINSTDYAQFGISGYLTDENVVVFGTTNSNGYPAVTAYDIINDTFICDNHNFITNGNVTYVHIAKITNDVVFIYFNYSGYIYAYVYNIKTNVSITNTNSRYNNLINISNDMVVYDGTDVYISNICYNNNSYPDYFTQFVFKISNATTLTFSYVNLRRTSNYSTYTAYAYIIPKKTNNDSTIECLVVYPYRNYSDGSIYYKQIDKCSINKSTLAITDVSVKSTSGTLAEIGQDYSLASPVSCYYNIDDDRVLFIISKNFLEKTATYQKQIAIYDFKTNKFDYVYNSNFASYDLPNYAATSFNTLLAITSKNTLYFGRVSSGTLNVLKLL